MFFLLKRKKQIVRLVLFAFNETVEVFSYRTHVDYMLLYFIIINIFLKLRITLSYC